MSRLRPMSPRRSYDQYCSAARALDLVGDRWTLLIVRELLAGRRTTANGRHVQLDGVQLESAAPAVPVLVGARGRASLRAAHSFADGVLLAEPCTPEYVRRCVGDLPRGRAGDFLVAGYNIGSAAMTPDSEQHLRHALSAVGDPAWAPHLESLPYAEEMRTMRLQSRDDEEFARAMPVEWVRDLSLSGPADDIARRLDELGAAGCTSTAISLTGPDHVRALWELGAVISVIKSGSDAQ